MKSDIDKEIIRRIKKKREELKITQRTLAEMLNVSQGFIAQVETESHHCKYSTHQVYQIAKYFGCQVSDFYPTIDPLEP
ncbi:MAG: helix-turn-helix domain-containing protein [Rikenellaceae bacterium]|nr:helix-turn-helix domain-containing protein [Rikenellaceae bacterium]